jgi:hypothetical protein
VVCIENTHLCAKDLFAVVDLPSVVARRLAIAT